MGVMRSKAGGRRFYFILSLFGFHIRDFSLKSRPVQLHHSLRPAAAASGISRRSNTNVNTTTGTTQHHTMSRGVFTVLYRTLSGFNAVKVIWCK